MSATTCGSCGHELEHHMNVMHVPTPCIADRCDCRGWTKPQ